VPELPDITIYVEALRARVVEHRLERIRVKRPFLLRTFEPPVESVVASRVHSVDRMGKRIVFGLSDHVHAVIHLMIAGRLLWYPAPGSADTKSKGAGRDPLSSRVDLAAFEFESGTLLLTEAGTKHRASLHIVKGQEALHALNPAGVEPLTCTVEEFAAALRRENRTLKRALTDPRIVSGIGNAYSDEILFRARMSPFTLTRSLSHDGYESDVERLLIAASNCLLEQTDVLRRQFGMFREGHRVGRGVPPPGSIGRFPGVGEITAFRPDFEVHGKYKQPCTMCGTPIQRVVYAENEMNYCPKCQTGGKVLADRSLSRLLKDDWPRTIEELERM